MSWRTAKDSDLAAINSFLRLHIQSSMFALANLRDFGLNGRDPRSLKMWILGENLRAVFAITNEGMILTQCPDCTDDEFRAAIGLIANRPLLGLAGEAAQARRIIRLAGWGGRPATLNSDEPGFALNLDQLVMPEISAANLIPLSNIDRSIAERWRERYLFEAMDFEPTQAAEQARKDILSYVERDSHRALLVDGQPAGMTGFNARLPDIVQIGGVYTPPEMRGRGYARHAVALHLREARDSGAARAVLFAASDAAARAYTAIGFTPAGEYSLILFKNTEVAA